MDPNQVKQIKAMIRLLKLHDFTLILGRTVPMGELGLKFTKDEEEPQITLDGVYLDKKTADDLKAILGL